MRELNSLRSLRQADLRLFRKIAGWRSTPAPRLRRAPATPIERLMTWLSLSANMSRIWLAIAAVLFKFGGRTGKRAAVRGVASIGITSAIVNFLVKPAVKRKRPSRDRIPAARQLVRQPLSTSFPSGHAASAFAFAIGTAVESRRAGALIAPLAAGVAYSRTFNGVHYPLDVAAGATIGTAVAIGTRSAWPDLPKREQPEVEPPARRAAPASADGGEVAMVFNPVSGSDLDPARASIDEIRGLLPAAEIVELDEGDNVLEAARAAAAGASILGVCGGDGTVAAAAQAAVEAGKPLLVVPGGTMNHLAHDLGIRGATDAVEALRRGEAAEIDIATIDGQVFLDHVSFGAHTALVEKRRTLEPRIGRWPGQILAAAQTTVRTEPVEVAVDGEPRSVWVAFIGNGTHHDVGIAPGWRRSLSDGTLDMRLLDARQHRSRAGALLALIAGGVRRSWGIEVARPARVTLRALDGDLRLTRDGEPFEAAGQVQVEARGRKLLVYAPHG